MTDSNSKESNLMTRGRSDWMQYGEEAVKEGVGAGGAHGGMDMFSELFGGGRRPRGPRKGEDVVHRLTVSLKDFYMGTSKYVAASMLC